MNKYGIAAFLPLVLAAAALLAGLMLPTTHEVSFREALAGAAQPGDGDCDGVVNAIDAALILQFSVGLTTLPCAGAADVNGDDRVDSIDATLVLQLAAGLIDAFVRCDISVGPSTAQSAIDRATGGTTVCLRDGTYSSIDVISKSDLTIAGTGSATIMVGTPGSDGCVFVFESQRIEISGLTTRNCDERGAFAASSTDVVFRRVETRGGPVGFHYVRSSGEIVNSTARDHRRTNPPGIGVLLNDVSTVTVEGSNIRDSDIGVLARDDSTLVIRASTISDNTDVGVNTLVAGTSSRRSGATSIERSTLRHNGLGVFAGVPGCAPLPPADPVAPACYTDAPSDFVSDVTIEISDSTISDSEGTGVVIFPGVRATISRSYISGSGLTGLFAWGAEVEAEGNEYANNVENAIECRAFPDPASGDRGLCRFTDEHIHDSRPLPGNRLGGGFVSEGGEFRLLSSVIEENWGIGVSVHNLGKGEIIGNTIENNGGTAFCISESTWLERRNNITAGNRPGECIGHP